MCLALSCFLWSWWTSEVHEACPMWHSVENRLALMLIHWLDLKSKELRLYNKCILIKIQFLHSTVNLLRLQIELTNKCNHTLEAKTRLNLHLRNVSDYEFECNGHVWLESRRHFSVWYRWHHLISQDVNAELRYSNLVKRVFVPLDQRSRNMRTWKCLLEDQKNHTSGWTEDALLTNTWLNLLPLSH